MWLGELALLFRRRRIQVLLVVLAVIPAAIAVAVKVGGGPGDGEGPTFLNQVTHNGVFAALAALSITLPVFLPLAVSVVAGDAIAGEAGLGTLRYLLTRPSGRSRLLLVKAGVVAVFCLAAVVVVSAAGLVTGVLLFPVGRVTTLSGDSLPVATGILRLVAATGVVGMSLLGLATVGLFVSTLTDVPVGAMAATLAVAVLVAVVDALPQTRSLHPWLFTHGWPSFTELLRTRIDWHPVLRDLELQAAYVAIFGSAAWARFSTKDVLS
jgi:ABC-2 type transport system permease protein